MSEVDVERVDEALGRIKNMLNNNGYSVAEIEAVIKGLIDYAEEKDKDLKEYKERMN